jgi:putative FmdB family regulatory protein
MPLYEYKCLKCHHEFEKLMKLNSPNPLCTQALETSHSKVLERCDGETKRIMSRSEFHLKGECWARDGYTYHDGIDRD